MTRGRPGESRYKRKRQVVIVPEEVEVTADRLDDPGLRSLLWLGYYTGLRLAEIVGDGPRRWKILSAEGHRLSRDGALPRDREWMQGPEGGLWEWRTGEAHPGIKKEDIIVQRGTLFITAKSVKHGRRDFPLELSTRLPYMMLILDTWNKTPPGEKVWPYSENKVWRKLTKASAGTIYPHSLRFSRAKSMAKTEGIAISDMLSWFGWARANTADSYLSRERSMAKARASIEQSMGEEGLA